MRVNLTIPDLGISDEEAFSKQALRTTRDAQNVRPTDGPTGRNRVAVRPGLERVSSTTINGTNVGARFMAQIVYDSRKVEYTGITPTAAEDEVKWALERRRPCYAGDVDRHGNVYSIDGNATVTKYNNTGTLQWSIAVPVPDSRFSCRNLAVDEFGIVYIGTSTGGLDKDAKLFAIEQLEDGLKAGILWEVETQAFVEDLALYKGRLVTLQNQTSTGESWVVAYDGIETLEPAEAWRARASHPANSIAIGPTGNVYVVAEEVTTTRGRDPRSTFSGRITEDWKLADLTDVGSRVWAEYDPALLKDLGLENGDDVTIWPDSSGNGRDLFQKVGSGAPTLIANSLGRLPGVFFEGSITTATPPVLVSGPNLNVSAAFADQQKTVLPAYREESSTKGYTDNAQCVLFILFRPRRTFRTAGKGMGLFRQFFAGGSSGTTDNAHHIALNTQSDAAALNSATTADGYVRWHSGAGAGTPIALANAGGTGQVVSATSVSATASGCVLLTVVLNHGADNTHGGATGTDDHPSQLRVNGQVVDEWDFRANATPTTSYLADTFSPTEIGSLDFGQPTNFEGFEGTIHYMAVLNRRTTNTDSAPCTYPFTQNAATSDFAPDTTGDSELERIEGWIAHRFGVAHILHSSHPFTDTKGTPNRSGITAHSQPWLLNQNYQTLAKYTPSGELRWVATSFTAYRGTFTAQGLSGLGYGVAVDSEGGIYTVGPHQLPTSPPDDYTQLRKIIDLGDSYTATANVTSSTGSGGTPTSASSAWGKTWNDYTESTALTNQDIAAGYHYPRVRCDTLNNVYYPWSATTGAFSGVALIAYDKTGGNGLTGNRALTGNNGLGLSFSQNAYVAVPDPKVPTFDATSITGSNQNAKPRAEFVWLFTDLGSGGAGFFLEQTVHKVRLLTVGATTGSPRTHVVASVAAGAIKLGTSTISAPAGSGTLAQPELSSTSEWIDGMVAYGKLYLTDRAKYVEYDPKTGIAKEYKATKGKIAARASLLKFWRGRAVVARMADDGHLWHMSAQGDVYDWDTDPPVVTATQSIDGSSSGRIGRCPDIINAFVPVNDDIALILGDHSVWQLTGDPQAGGEFDLVSNAVGGAFGRGQVLDPAGNVYWFGTRGGVFRKAPFGGVERISTASIERRLQAVDLSTVLVWLEWDYENEGLLVMQRRYSPDGTALKHWFFDERKGGWWEDKYGVDGSRVQPVASITADADDPDDRTLLFACEDGFIRRVSRDAKRDDTTAAGTPVAIASHLLVGPVWSSDAQTTGRITSVTAELSRTDGGALVELFASEHADILGTAKSEFEALPGQNPMRHVRARHLRLVEDPQRLDRLPVGDRASRARSVSCRPKETSVSRRNVPLTGPVHRARVASNDPRARRNAAIETTSTPMGAPFTIDRRTGKQALALDRSVRVTPDNKLGVNPIPAMPDLPESTSTQLLVRHYNLLLAGLRARGLMRE